jgi:hypothetical protein
MREYLEWRKTIFGIFFLYDNTIIGDSSISEQGDDILDLRCLRTIVTYLEEFIPLCYE